VLGSEWVSANTCRVTWRVVYIAVCVDRISAEAKQVHSKCMEKYDESLAGPSDLVKQKKDVVAAWGRRLDGLDDDLPAKAEVIGGLEHQVLVLEDKLDTFNVVSHTQDGKTDREGINDG
jgi:hypothetical protein